MVVQNSCKQIPLEDQKDFSNDSTIVQTQSENQNKPSPDDSISFRRTSGMQVQKLIQAAKTGDFNLVKTITTNGVDVNSKICIAKNYCESPLSEAIRYKNYDIVEYLIKHGADPNLDVGKSTPFHYAIGSSPVEILDLLLKKGAEINQYNELNWNHPTPLSYGISTGNFKNVKRLIELGALIDPDSLNGNNSPLGRAAAKLEHEMFKELLEHGANVDATYTEPYEDCILCPEEITITHFLVGMYYYTDKDKVGPFLDLVLARTPNLNIENSFGYTPLEFAMLGDNYELVERLIDAEAKLETEGYSSLHVAAQFSNHEMVDYLITKGVNVNIKDEYEGNTPLMLCMDCCGGGFGDGITYEDRIKTIRLLIDSGADPYIKNNEGKSFMESVKSNKYPEITALLLDFGFIKEKDIEK